MWYVNIFFGVSLTVKTDRIVLVYIFDGKQYNIYVLETSAEPLRIAPWHSSLEMQPVTNAELSASTNISIRLQKKNIIWREPI